MVRRTGPSGHGRRFPASQVDKRCIDNSHVTTAWGGGGDTAPSHGEIHVHRHTYFLAMAGSV